MREVSVHGISLTIPLGLDLAGTAGNWARGRMMLARDGREPTLLISWERRGITPDPGRMRRNLARHICTDGDMHSISSRALPAVSEHHGALLTAAAGNGLRHAAWRYVSDSGTVVMVRDIRPGAADVIIDLIASLSTARDDASASWHCYGLHIDCPPWWRLHALEVTPGLARGVWMRRAKRELRTSGVIVQRRLALAERILSGATLGDWLTSRLDRGETIRERHDFHHSGGAHFITNRPGTTWFERLLRRRS